MSESGFIDKVLKEKLNDLNGRCNTIKDIAISLVKCRKAKIISNYNGQMYGNSKPSMKGKIITINSCILDNHEIFFFADGLRVSLRIDEIEFL